MMAMRAYQVLLVADEWSTCVWNLADRIEKEAPGVKVCGVVLRTSGKSSREQKFKLTLIDHLLRIVHGSVGLPFRQTRDWGELPERCEQRGWPVLFGDETGSDEVAKFVQDRRPDLALLLAQTNIDPILLSPLRHGSLRAKVTSQIMHPVNHPSAGKLVRGKDLVASIDPPFDGRNAQRVASVTLTTQPFDTLITTELVSELVTSDLIIRTVASFQEAKGDAIIRKLSILVQEIPGASDAKNENWKSLSRWRLRPAWKLVFHTLVLISPFIVLRNWYRRLRGRFPVVILFHHLVSNRPHRMGIPTELFLEQVRFLEKHYRVVSLAQAAEILRSGSCKQPTVALTFDDGYMDNFLYLRAVGESTGVPVSMFVSTQLVERGGEFEHDVRKGEVGFHAINWDQIRLWQSGRVEFGSHTRSHFNCGSRDIRTLENEIIGSREDMKNRLGTSPVFFAFPWGQTGNMSPDAIEMASSTYQCSFSTLPVENFADNGKMPKVLGRKALPSTVWELELTVQSIFDLMAKVRGKGEKREYTEPSS